MKDVLFFVIGGAAGFIIAYYYFGGGTANFTCNGEQVTIQYCWEEKATEMPTDQDATLRQYYVNALAAGDTSGFTLRRDLFFELSAYLTFDHDSKGIRFYPGMVANNKILIIKPLDGSGNEKPDVGKSIELGTDDIDGPCPKWCGRGSRIITE